MPIKKNIAGEITVLYTLDEAAAVLGVSERTLRTYIYEGRIPACKLRRRWYIWDKNLNAYLRGAKSTKTYKPVQAPQYDAAEYAPDPWEQGE